MKKIFCFVITGLITTTLFSQTMVNTTGKTTFGIRAGVNFQNINGKNAAGSTLKNDLLTGFNAGVNAEIPIGSGFFVQPGVLYSTKGAKWTNEDKVKLSYIEVPVNFVYKPILGSGNMLLGFGPYVGFAMNGNVEYENGTETDVEFTNDYDPSISAPQFKKMDAGANLLAGYEFANKLSFQLNAQLGLMKINPEITTDDETSWKNTGFGVSLGYRF